MAMDDQYTCELVPYDAQVEILSRLPAKSLMRFKCVSKRWFSLITDPLFAELHYTRSHNRQRGGVFVAPSRTTDKLCVIDLNKEPLDRLSIVDPDIPYDNNSSTNIVNGLICFYHNSNLKRRVYLYNLTTRDCVSLPLNQIKDGVVRQFNNLTSSESITVEDCEDSNEYSSALFSRTCLLGFDPINKDYKVLHFSAQGYNRTTKCQVFTIGHRRKTWRPLETSNIQGFNDSCKAGFCMDGFLYWVEENGVVIFDVRLETFKLIRFPEPNVCYWSPKTVVKVQGYLFLLDVTRAPSSIIWWRLKGEDDTDEPQWTKEAVMYEHRFLKMHSVCDLNHAGQAFLPRYLLDSHRSIIDYYDLVVGEHMEFEVKNTRGIVGSCKSSRVTEVIDNIMPLP